MATKVIIPKLEMAQETATIIEWLKQEGEHIEKGEPLLVIETDKVTVELESSGSGILAGVRGEPGQEVPVTQVIAYLLQPGEELPEEVEAELEISPEEPSTHLLAARATPVARRLAAAQGIDLCTIIGTGKNGQITKQDVEAVLVTPPPEIEVPAGKVRATPATRRLAREQGVDLSVVKGTGSRGQVTAEDVLGHAQALKITVPALVETIPFTGMRRRIAERMRLSFETAPHMSVSLRINMNALEAARARLDAETDAQGLPRVSVTAIIVKVVAEVLKRHPWLNSTLQNDEFRLFSEINIGVAVALEEGLIVPVIHKADEKGFLEIATEVVDLATRAREDRLELAEVTGGTFTVSNLGPFGVEQFTPIINPPQAAILAIGVIHPEVAPDEDEQLVIRPMAWMTLTADHRIVDGAVAARFLTDLRDSLEDPKSYVE